MMLAWKEERRKKEADKWAKVRELASKQGLVLTQLSPRRYIVTKLSGDSGYSGCHHPEDHEKLQSEWRWVYYTYMSAEKVYGPASWEDCRAYILRVAMDEGTLVPEEVARA